VAFLFLAESLLNREAIQTFRRYMMKNFRWLPLIGAMIYLLGCGTVKKIRNEESNCPVGRLVCQVLPSHTVG